MLKFNRKKKHKIHFNISYLFYLKLFILYKIAELFKMKSIDKL